MVLGNLLMGAPNDPRPDQDTYTPGSGNYYAWDALTFDASMFTQPRLTDEIRDTIANWEKTYPNWGLPFSLYLDRTYINPDGETRFGWQGFLSVINGDLSIEQLANELQPQVLNGQQFGADWFYDFARDQANNQRRWLEIGGSDGPGWTQNDVDNAAAAIRDRAAQWGISLSDEEVNRHAQTAVQYEYSDARVIDALLDGIEFSQISTGEIAQGKLNLRNYANRYLVRLNEQDVNDLTERLFRQELTLDGLQAYLSDQAKINMPFLENYIDRGFTPIDVFKSPMNLAAEELGIDVSSIDIMDPEWNSVLIRTDDKGNQRVATNMEVRDAVRNMEGWEQTDAARRSATDIGMWLGNIMGVI